MPNYNFSIPGADNKPILIDITASADESNPLVIFVHGFKGFKDWGTHSMVAKYFAENGLNFLKFNFSHNGLKDNLNGDIFDDLESFENNTISKELFDISEVITFSLSGEKFSPPPAIYLIGHSLGGAISIIQAAKDKAVVKLATWASISSFRNLWTPHQEKTWMETGVLHFANSRTNQQMPINSTFLQDLNENSEKLEIITAAQKLTQPWLIVHGDADPTVPLAHAIELHNQNPQSELLKIDQADHVFSAAHPWKRETLPEPLLNVCNATIKFFQSADEE